MKTICPYCNQEYPETPDEYLGGTCECQTCHRDFTVEKVRFCRECGIANAAKAAKCRQCGYPSAISVPAVQPPPMDTLRTIAPTVSQSAVSVASPQELPPIQTEDASSAVSTLFYILGLLFYIVAIADFAGMFFGYDFTGQRWTPILFGGIGQFMFSIAGKIGKNE